MAALAIHEKKRRWWGSLYLPSAFLRLGKEARGCLSEGTTGEATQGAEQPRQPCSDELLLPCASCKIYICATEWQRLGAAALSAWLHQRFDIPGTFKMPLNASHWHQRAQRHRGTEQGGRSRGAFLEQPSCPGAEQPEGIRLPNRQMGASMLPQAHLFFSMLCKRILAGPNLPDKKAGGKGWLGPRQPGTVSLGVLASQFCWGGQPMAESCAGTGHHHQRWVAAASCLLLIHTRYFICVLSQLPAYFHVWPTPLYCCSVISAMPVPAVEVIVILSTF